MAALGLSLVIGALPAGASTRPAADSTREAFRGKQPTPTTDSTTPPSTVTVEPTTSTTTARPAPARSHTPQVQLSTTTVTVQSPISPAPSSSAGSDKATSTTTEPRNPHVVEGEASTTTSTEVSNAVVGNIGKGRGPGPVSPANQPARKRAVRSLGTTGAPTRSLLIAAGGTLMLGALAVAFGEASPVRATAGDSTGTMPGRRRRRVRRTLPGWESGIPLDPERRERVRQRVQRRQNRPRGQPPRRRTRSLIGVGPIEKASRILRSRYRR